MNAMQIPVNRWELEASRAWISWLTSRKKGGRKPRDRRCLLILWYGPTARAWGRRDWLWHRSIRRRLSGETTTTSGISSWGTPLLESLLSLILWASAALSDTLSEMHSSFTPSLQLWYVQRAWTRLIKNLNDNLIIKSQPTFLHVYHCLSGLGDCLLFPLLFRSMKVHCPELQGRVFIKAVNTGSCWVIDRRHRRSLGLYSAHSRAL